MSLQRPKRGSEENQEGGPGEVLGEAVSLVTWASVMVFIGVYECQNLSHFYTFNMCCTSISCLKKLLKGEGEGRNDLWVSHDLLFGRRVGVNPPRSRPLRGAAHD